MDAASVPGVTESRYDALITAIYGAVGQEAEAWNRLLPELLALFEADIGTLQISNPSLTQTALFTSVGASDVALDQYARHFFRKDLFVTRVPVRPLTADQSMSEIVFSADYVRDAELLGSEIYADLLRPQLGEAFHNAGGWARLQDDQLLVLGVQRVRRRGVYEPVARAQFQRIWQHLVQAMRLQQQLHLGQQAVRLAAAMLDALPSALLLVEADGRIALRNAAAARRLAQPGSGLRERRGQLSLAAVAEGRRLAAALARIAVPRPGAEDWGETIQVPRPDGGLPLMLRVAPLSTEQRQAPPWSGLGLGARPLALVLVSDPLAPRPELVRQAAALFGLTPAEARLAQALLEDVTVEDYAARQGVRVSTVRTQLQALLRKTGTERQASLLLLLSGLPVTA